MLEQRPRERRQSPQSLQRRKCFFVYFFPFLLWTRRRCWKSQCCVNNRNSAALSDFQSPSYLVQYLKSKASTRTQCKRFLFIASECFKWRKKTVCFVWCCHALIMKVVTSGAGYGRSQKGHYGSPLVQCHTEDVLKLMLWGCITRTGYRASNMATWLLFPVDKLSIAAKKEKKK